MLWNASAIKGYAIAASDGRIGTVSDFLFDDDSWLVRWLVVDTGNWLSGRKVLLPPSVLGQLDPNGTRVLGQIDHAAGQGQPGYRHRSARVAADGEPAFTITMVGARIGVRAFTWAATAMPGARWRHRLPGIQAAREEIAAKPARQRRSASPQHRSGHRVPYPCQRRRDRSRRGLSRGGYRLGHSLISSSIRRTGGPGRRS